MISNFDDLIKMAGEQAAPQRLLMVFVGAELPDDATAAQRGNYHAGQGGALVPIMCVDKRPEELASFAQLCAEADTIHPDWRLVLAGALPGHQGQAPSDHAVNAVFERWLADIQSGRVHQVLAQTLAFERSGQAVNLQV